MDLNVDASRKQILSIVDGPRKQKLGIFLKFHLVHLRKSCDNVCQNTSNTITANNSHI